MGRRPTISKPTDFRRSDASFDFLTHENAQLLRAVSPVERRLSPFRPLQLSIYIPGNELPALPRFSDDDNDDDVVPPVPGIERPPQALMTMKSEPIMNRRLSSYDRRLSSFSIPRKPVGGSRVNSTELTHVPRTSIDSGLTLNNNDASISTHKYSTSIERQYIDHRPSLSAAKSAKEFVEMINAPLPPLPQSTPTSHQTGSSIYRSASDQNLRLQTHLEERQATIQAWETISEKEERSPVSPLTPPQPHIAAFATSATSRNSQIFIQKAVQQHADATGLAAPQHQRPNINDHPAWTDSGFEFPVPTLSKARSSAGSSTLNEKALEAGVVVPRMNEVDASRPSYSTTVSATTVPVGPTTPALSTRLSAWLARSIASMQQASAQDALTDSKGAPLRNSNYTERSRDSNSIWDVSYPAPLTIGAGAVTLPGEIQKAKSAPSASKSKPLIVMGHARQQSSVSTYVTSPLEGRGEVVDMEKLAWRPVVVTEQRISTVGVAF